MRKVTAKTEQDIKDLAGQLKQSACQVRDDDQRFYSKSLEDVKGVVDAAEFLRQQQDPNERQKRIQEMLDKCQALLLYKDEVISIAMTRDDYHGQQYHTSLCCFGKQQMQKISDETLRVVCENFFEVWMEVPNPGKMHWIRHVAGSDATKA